MNEELFKTELCALKDELTRIEKSFERRFFEVEKTLREVRDKVISTIPCPAPGLCVKLDAKADTHEKRLSAIEYKWGMIIGACAILNILGALVVGIIIKII